MKFNKKITNLLIIALSTLVLSACSTAKKSGTGSGDVYTGNATVEYLASGVKEYSLQLIAHR
jgi:outer membrane murein-binding lipoprotein Lpp